MMRLVGVATLPKSGRVVGVLVASAPLSLRQGGAWGGAPQVAAAATGMR